MIKKNDSYLLLLEIAKKNWQIIIFALILVVLVSFLESVSALLIAPFLSALNNTNISESQVPKAFRAIISYYNEFPYDIRLVATASAILLFTGLKNLLAYILGINFYKVELQTGQDLRKKCIKRLLSLEINYFNQAKMGDILNYINEQSQRCQSLTNSLIQLIRDFLITFFLTILLVNISWQLTIISILIFGLIGITIKTILVKIRIAGNEVVKSIENFSGVITEIIQGIIVIKAFNAENKEQKRSDVILQERLETELKAYKYVIIPPPLTETLGIGAILLVVLSGAIVLRRWEAISLPMLLTYTFALLRILPRLVQINNLRSQLSLFFSSLDAIHNFLETTKKYLLPNGNLSYKPWQQNQMIIFKNVTFKFSNNLEPTLKKIDIEIPPGKTTAFVGSSGSGKSTLINLVMRFYDPSEGYIEVDGIDLKKFRVDSWRQHIALVQQDTFLFNTSVSENIAYGNPIATEQQIIDAAKKAYAYEFIQELPQGFETILGNRGTKLSGGQRQRIAIARAILREPDLLILDEATSALDTNSERIVQKAIEEVSLDRTVLVIAHRLSTVEKADKIVVLDRGIVVEQGTHQELLQQKGEYWSLYNSQVTYSHSTNY